MSYRAELSRKSAQVRESAGFHDMVWHEKGSMLSNWMKTGIIAGACVAATWLLARSMNNEAELPAQNTAPVIATKAQNIIFNRSMNSYFTELMEIYPLNSNAHRNIDFFVPQISKAMSAQSKNEGEISRAFEFFRQNIHKDPAEFSEIFARDFRSIYSQQADKHQTIIL